MIKVSFDIQRCKETCSTQSDYTRCSSSSVCQRSRIHFTLKLQIYYFLPGDVLRNGPLDVDGHALPQASINGPQIGNTLYSAQKEHYTVNQ